MLEWARRVLVSHIAVREITAAELNSTKRRGRRRTVVTVAASVCSSQTCPSVCVCVAVVSVAASALDSRATCVTSATSATTVVNYTANSASTPDIEASAEVGN